MRVYRDGDEFIRDLSPAKVREQINKSLTRLDIETIDL
jgi:aryl-alcohol dehydrogenase-like predicted oxidoreductase